MQQFPESVSHVTTYSDTCEGQNRNKNILAAMLYAINRLQNFKTIDIKFIKSGYSYLEADSMHATIERQENKKICTTQEWHYYLQLPESNQVLIK